jgi:hypothetical protein
MTSAASAAAMACLVALTGCPDRSISEVAPEQTRVEYKDIPVTVNRQIDILFLIDDSQSMAPKQQNLADNFPNFINVLNTVKGGLPDVHIGITTSDMGASSTDTGIGPGVSGCTGTGRGGKLQVLGTTAVSGSYLSDVASQSGSGRDRNYTGDLATVFSTMATGVGAHGCGFEQHLEAIRSALGSDSTTGSVATNAGFLRPDAYLAIIIIADEDDCSLSDTKLLEGDDSSPFGPLESFRCTRYGVTCDVGGTTPDEMNVVGAKSMCHSNESGAELTKVQRYIDFMRSLKADPQDVIIALIGGPNTPVATELRTDPQHMTTPIPALAHSCHYTDGQGSDENADPSIRQTQFMNAFPNRFTFTTICNNDLTGGLTQIAQLVKQVFGDACIEGELATPFQCSVSDVVNPGTSMASETILPECIDVSDSDTSPNVPCWVILPDAANCGMNDQDPDMLALRVKRNNVKPDPNTHVIANCVTNVTEGSGGTGSD